MDKMFGTISEDKIELIKEAELKKQRTLTASITPHRNHILFEFDLVNKVVRRAEFTSTFVFGVSSKKKKEVDGKEGCIYISAMNEASAWKKFIKEYKNV